MVHSSGSGFSINIEIHRAKRISGRALPNKWHTFQFAWDCSKHVCELAIDSKQVTKLEQFSAAPGVCYLRLWSSAEKTDKTGLLVESVEVSVEP